MSAQKHTSSVSNTARSSAISLFLIIALVGFPQVSETIYTPALPDIAYSLNASAHAIELTLSIYFLGFACGVCVWGTASDLIGRRISMLLGLGIYTACSWYCGIAQHIAPPSHRAFFFKPLEQASDL